MPLIRKPPGPPAPAAADPRADLRSESAEARWSAARSLASPEAVAPLAEALAREADPMVREAILTSLARIATPQSAQVLTPLIRSDDASLRTGALDALRAMPQAVLASLPALLSDPDPDVRLLACEIVRELAEAEATGLLTALIATETEANVCAAAVEVLAEVGGPEALPALELCATRFAQEPFLVFSIKVARDRLLARPAPPGG